MKRYIICRFKGYYIQYMARVNLNKSEWLVTNTTAASKYMHKRPRICINWNPPFQIQILVNVNIVKQDLRQKSVGALKPDGNKKAQCLTSPLHHCHLYLDRWPPQFLKILWSVVWKGGFQLIQILASWVCIWCCSSRSQGFFTFIQIGSGHTVHCLHIAFLLNNSIESNKKCK